MSHGYLPGDIVRWTRGGTVGAVVHVVLEIVGDLLLLVCGVVLHDLAYVTRILAGSSVPICGGCAE